jgi:hypothetical protein
LRLEPAQLIEHPREAERLLESTGWLPQLLRTQDLRTQDLPTPALPLADPNAGDCADGG